MSLLNIKYIKPVAALNVVTSKSGTTIKLVIKSQSFVYEKFSAIFKIKLIEVYQLGKSYFSFYIIANDILVFEKFKNIH